MIYPTIGVPSRFSEWCEAIFRELLVAANGIAPEIFVADTLEQVGSALLARCTTSALVVSRQPNRKFVETVMAGKIPVMVTLDESENQISDLMADHNETFPDAMRRVANCLSSLLPLINYQNALRFNASDNLSVLEIATAIAAHFEINLDQGSISKAVQNLPERFFSSSAAPPPSALKGIVDALSARAAVRGAYGYRGEDYSSPAEILSAALAPLWTRLNGDPLGEIFWHPVLFFVGDHPSDAAITPIDVTGTGRCLFFGPYIHLPDGAWTCNLLLGCAKDAVGVGLRVDVFAGVALNSTEVEISEPGLFEIEMSFVNRNPDAPIEIRLFSMKPNFEGNLLPGSVRLTPQRANQLRAG